MRILIVTNDGTVFLKDEGKAEEILGGRVREVLDLKRSLSDGHDVSLALISGRYGLISGDRVISQYSNAPDTSAGYAELQTRTDYAGRLKVMSRSFDMTMVFVPKDMMRILIAGGSLPRNTLAVTSPEFIDVFEKNGWKFLERKGARIGNKNAESIRSLSSLL